MSAEIIPFPADDTADAAWDYYTWLLSEREADPSLFKNRDHCERVIKAHAAFERAFKRECGI